jgi:hypothetical protein
MNQTSVLFFASGFFPAMQKHSASFALWLSQRLCTTTGKQPSFRTKDAAKTRR